MDRLRWDNLRGPAPRRFRKDVPRCRLDAILPLGGNVFKPDQNPFPRDLQDDAFIGGENPTDCRPNNENNENGDDEPQVLAKRPLEPRLGLWATSGFNDVRLVRHAPVCITKEPR